MEASVAQAGVMGEGEMLVTYRGVSVVLVPSERMTKGERTFDVRKAGDRACIYTFLYRGTKGGFSGNRLARLRGEAEVGWLSRSNHLHPQDTPEKAAMHYLRWSYERGRRGRKTSTLGKVAS